MTLLAAFIEYCVSCAPSGNATAPVVGTAAGIAGAAGALTGASSPSTPSGSIAGGPGGDGESTGAQGAGGTGTGTTPMPGGGVPPTVTILDGGATGRSMISHGFTFYEYVYTVNVNGSISVYTQWLDTLDPAKAAADAILDIQDPGGLDGDLGGIA